MLHYETISPDTLELLRRIQSLDLFKDTRLVGGTALALQLGHRLSVDLDIFGPVVADLDEIVADISSFASVSPISSSKMMRFLVVNGVKLDIVNYPYTWIDEPVEENGIMLAGIKDISAMKLSAITNRGTRKDFIDLYFLLRLYPIDFMLGFYREKYSDAQLFTAVKSLTYFDDAENEPMPIMIEPVEWESVKSTIITAVNRYCR